MKSSPRANLIAVVALLALIAAGCGSSGGSSTSTSTTTSASATETWATGVCTSITTWQAALKSAAGSLKSDPSENGLQTAGDDAKAATETLASDLKGLGKPDTQAGQEAKTSLDQLATSLQQSVATIESAVKGASGLGGALKAVPTVTATLATMETQVKTTVTSLEGLGAKGELKTAFASSSACKSLRSGS
jgi:hypothetical protein